MPEFETFLTAERMTIFWDNVKWLLFFVAPIIMIFFASDVLSLLIGVIKKTIGIKTKNDDDDYDVHHY